jgi:enoyl-CoA hydratase/carnithine racemase
VGVTTSAQQQQGHEQPAVMQKMAEEGASFGRMLKEPAAKEAFGAFMEKRKPDFSKL